MIGEIEKEKIEREKIEREKIERENTFRKKYKSYTSSMSRASRILSKNGLNNVIIECYIGVTFLLETCEPIIHAMNRSRTENTSEKHKYDVDILFKHFPEIYETMIYSCSVKQLSSCNSDDLRFVYKTNEFKILFVISNYYYEIFYNLQSFVKDVNINKKMRKEIIRYHKVCPCGTTHALKKCADCKKVYYCSKKCQINDWIKHKPKCTYGLTYDEAIKKLQIYKSE
jgi:hypothetical protein